MGIVGLIGCVCGVGRVVVLGVVFVVFKVVDVVVLHQFCLSLYLFLFSRL